MKLFLHYKISDSPWGGGNSFLKAFKDYLINNSSDYLFVDDIYHKYDILFVNGGHKSPGVYIDVDELRRIKTNTFRQKLRFRKIPKIVYRIDGARTDYTGEKSEMDDIQFQVLMLADYVIFQSNYCLDTFRKLGYNKTNFSIIFNGVNQLIFNLFEKEFMLNMDKLNVFSSNWSANKNKGYEIIAKFSKSDLIHSSFVGNWNNDVKDHNVHILPPVNQQELAGYYKQNNVFLHAAKNDPCPNVVLEALSCGLPVIYHNSGGTPEIAKNYGIPLPDEITPQSIEETIVAMKEKYQTFVERIKTDHHKFSIQYSGKQYLDVFNSAVNG